jgi:hypothetical protein
MLWKASIFQNLFFISLYFATAPLISGKSPSSTGRKINTSKLSGLNPVTEGMKGYDIYYEVTSS